MMKLYPRCCNFGEFKFSLTQEKNMNCDKWTVQDAALSESFPTQNDSDSCGVYVCLYATLLLKKAVLDEKLYKEDYTIRRPVLLEFLENTFFKENHPFGLKLMLILRNLDETILTIASAEENSDGENLERHKTFLRDPTFFMDCTW